MATQYAVNLLYVPLDRAKKEIRLLRVKSYPKDDDVLSICECTMFTACLADRPAPKYNAFSYEWNYAGDLSEDYAAKDAIIVNGNRVPASANLVALLTRFRNVSQTMPDYEPFQLPLWIDAICINQSDVEERNSQVAMMGAIYTKAQATLAWLGESEDDSDYAMQIIGDVGTKLLKQVRKADNQLAWIDPDSQPELWQRTGSLNRFWDSAGALMRRSYWKRAWIIQEVLLQPNVVIFCGRNIGHYLQIEAIYHWLKRIQHKPCPSGVDEELWNLLSTKVGWYKMGWNNMQKRIRSIPSEDSSIEKNAEMSRHLQWKTWIVHTMSKQASDPRDKLYSVLGLVGINDLKPDYSCSAEKVFYDYAADDIRLCKSLDILSYAGYFELPVELTTPAMSLFVPSWVPNWDQISKAYSFTWTHRKGDTADKDWRSVISVAEGKVPWSIGEHTLTTQGVLFDTISETRTCNLSDGSWLAFCHEYVESQDGELYPSGIPPLQALALLVLRGWGYDEEPLGPDPSINDLVYRALPGFLLTLWLGPSDTQAEDMKYEQSRLGLSNPQDVISNFIGDELVQRQQLSKRGVGDDDDWKDLAPNTLNFRDTTSRGMEQHRLFRTKKGYLGWGHVGVREGDLVCVLPTCSPPVLLRDVDMHQILLGSCHVTGLMRGEAVVAAREGKAGIKTFNIV